jgi:hydrogenase/urease accessory protein HupE
MRPSPRNCETWALGLLLASVSLPAHAHAPGLDKELPALPMYLRLGFEHILSGYDHLAFLLGLMLVRASLRANLLAVTSFTLAHSLSLGLSMFGVLAPPSSWVETAIALSVAYVGVENFFVRDGSKRFRISFVFGFVHGFGFAGALHDIGVPPDRAPAALALFNLGLELGQLAVLALLLPLLAGLRRGPKSWPVAARVLNGSLLLLGLFWASQRTFFAPAAPQLAAAAQVSDDVVASRALLVSASAQARHPAPSAATLDLCALFQRLPRERRAQCSGRALGPTLERACGQVLETSLAGGALRYDASAAAECGQQQRARYASCEFMQAGALSPLAACASMWQGQLSVGERCSSSLECQTGLQCSGVGPLDTGVCAAPKPVGAPCGRALDTLTAYLPQRTEDHPECAGSCLRGRCSD